MAQLGFLQAGGRVSAESDIVMSSCSLVVCVLQQFLPEDEMLASFCLDNFDLTDYRLVLNDLCVFLYQDSVSIMQARIQPMIGELFRCHHHMFIVLFYVMLWLDSSWSKLFFLNINNYRRNDILAD